MRPSTRTYLAVPAAVLCAIAGLAFRGAFDVSDLIPVCVAATVLPCAIVALATWLAGKRALVFLIGGAAVGWLTLLPLSALGIAGWRGGDHQPVSSFFSVLRSAVTDGTRQLLTTTSPARPTAVLLATVGTCLWWAAVWTAAAAVRGTTPAAVLLPPVILLGLGTAASAGAGNPGSIAIAAAFFVAAVLFLGIELATRSQPGEAVAAAGQRARRGASLLHTVPFFAGITALALAAAAASPHLPGLAERRPWDPRNLVTPADQPYDETDPLTQAVAWLKEDSPAPLFSVTSPDGPQRLRWQVLDTFDGAHWTTSAVYRSAGKALPPGDAVSDPAGPGVPVRETVRIDSLASAFLPAAGRVRSVSGTDVRVAPDLGMIATGDGHAAPGSLSYSVDATVPVFNDLARLESAQPGAGGSLDPLLAVPEDMPDNLTAFAATAAVGDTPYDQMTALATAVSQAFPYVPDSAAGQSFGRLSTLLAYGKLPDDSAGAGADAFAALFAVAARQVGFPARVVVGFVPGTPDASAASGASGASDASGTSSVTGKDVRVWPEVYFQGVGWVPFYGAVPDGQGSDGGSVPVQRQQSTVPTSEPSSAPTSAPGPSYTGPSAEIATPATGGQGSATALILAGVAVVLVIALLVGFAVFGGLAQRRRLAARRGDPDPRLRTQWAWLESLDALGVDARTTSTPSEVAAAAADPLGPEGAEPIRGLAGLAELAAYGAEAPGPEQADQAWAYADQIRVLWRRRTPRRVRAMQAMRWVRPPGRSGARRH